MTRARPVFVLYVLAFGMILRWRLGMLAEYRRLRREPATVPGWTTIAGETP